MPVPVAVHSHFIVFPIRLVPEETEAVERRLAECLGDVFGVGGDEVLFLHAMGLQDAVVVLHTDRFEDLGRLPADLPGLKSITAQYCYAHGKSWAAVMAPLRNQPLTVVSFLRLDERLAMASYSRAIDRAAEEIKGACRGRAKGLSHLRCLGWPDVIMLASGNSPAALSEAARDVWRLRLAPEESGEGAPEAVHAFCRTYSLLATPQRPGPIADVTSSRLHEVREGAEMPAPRVEFRLRADRGAHVTAAARWMATEGAVPVLTHELGHEDLALSFARTQAPAPEESAKPVSVNARQFLTSYWHGFMGEIQATRDAFSSQLCVGIPVDDGAQVPAHVPPALAGLEGPLVYLARADGAPGTRSLAASLRTAFRAVNWAAENEGVRLNFVDLYNHFRWLQDNFTSDLSHHSLNRTAQVAAQECSRAFAQRLAGSYYGMTGPGPEPLLLGVAAVHKVLLALWGLVAGVFQALDLPHPRSYWLISHGESPATKAGYSGNAPLSLPVCYALMPADGMLAIIHETTHAVLDAWGRPELRSILENQTLYRHRHWGASGPGDVAEEERHLLMLEDMCCDMVAAALGLGLSFEHYMRQLDGFQPLLGETPTMSLIMRAWVVHRFLERCELRAGEVGVDDPAKQALSERLELLGLSDAERPFALWTWAAEDWSSNWDSAVRDGQGASGTAPPWNTGSGRQVWLGPTAWTWRSFINDPSIASRPRWGQAAHAAFAQAERHGLLAPPFLTAYNAMATFAGQIVGEVAARATLGDPAAASVLCVLDSLQAAAEGHEGDKTAAGIAAIERLWDLAMVFLRSGGGLSDLIC